MAQAYEIINQNLIKSINKLHAKFLWINLLTALGNKSMTVHQRSERTAAVGRQNYIIHNSGILNFSL